MSAPAPTLVLALVLALSGALPLHAHPEETEVWDPFAATHLGGAHGLTGFGSMVDGRIPSPFLTHPELDERLGAYSTRFSLRYDLRVTRRGLRGAARHYPLRERRESLRATYGFAVRGLDVAIGVPLVEEERRFGRPTRLEAREREAGLDDLQLGLKVAFRIPEFLFGDWAIAAFAPYALARLPSGAERVSREGSLEAGLALAGPYGRSFRWIGNFALRYDEGGRLAGVYRFGASAVPRAAPDWTLRVYAHLAGTEYEGRLNSDVDLEGGAQLLIQDLVTLDVGVSFRIVDSGHVERGLARTTLARFGEVPRGWHRDDAFALTLAVGIVL